MANHDSGKRAAGRKPVGKRALSLLMALVMSLSLVQITAFAAETTGTTQQNAEIGTQGKTMTYEDGKVVLSKTVEKSDTGPNDFNITLEVTVKDESGQVIREFAIEGSHKGNVAFEWDGKDKSGNEAKSGKYSIEAHATVDGKPESVPALTYAKVESVTLGTSTNPSTLKLKGLGGIYLTDVLEIGATTGKTTTQSASSSNAVI